MATQSDRVSRLEGIVEAILDRLNSIDGRIGDLDNRVSALESRIDSRLTALESRVDTRFNWMFGLMVTTWITTMIALIAILIRV